MSDGRAQKKNAKRHERGSLMTGAQAVISSLEAEGVELIFGYPGGSVLAIYDALEAKGAPKGRYEVYQDKNEEYRFRLKAGNNEVIAVSEGYKSKAACLKGIESVKRNAAAEVVEE